MVGAAQCRPNGLSSTTWPVVSSEIEPRFPRHGAGNRSSFSSKTFCRKSVPNFRPHVAGIELADLDGGFGWGIWTGGGFGWGIWILECGLGDLDGGFGFWIGDWGIWMGGFSPDYLPPFGFCIRYFQATPTRVGGFPGPSPKITNVCYINVPGGATQFA